jgi:hypothetical protein
MIIMLLSIVNTIILLILLAMVLGYLYPQSYQQIRNGRHRDKGPAKITNQRFQVTSQWAHKYTSFQRKLLTLPVHSPKLKPRPIRVIPAPDQQEVFSSKSAARFQQQISNQFSKANQR